MAVMDISNPDIKRLELVQRWEVLSNG